MKIIEAYKSIAVDELNDDGSPIVVYSWKYEDDTGNAMAEGTDAPFFIKGVKFEHEPANFIDEAYYEVEAIAPNEIPFALEGK